MSNLPVHNIIIIGSGPAGLTAALYAGRAFLKPLVIEGDKPGGQLMTTTFIENWPGHKSISGAQLMMLKKEHAQHFGAEFLSESVVSVDFSKRPFRVTTSGKKDLYAHSVLIATGACANRLWCPGEETYFGKGVSTCAVCDGALYYQKPVVVVGGGDTAMEYVSFLSKFTSHITLVHILPKLTASAVMQERIFEAGTPKPFVSIMYESTVTEIKGNHNHVTEIEVTHQKTQEKKIIKAEGLFLAIGQKPNTVPFKDHVACDAFGFIKVTNHTQTSVPGVFVAGDVADYRYRQAIVSAGSGCMAALDAQRYLEEQGLM